MAKVVRIPGIEAARERLDQYLRQRDEPLRVAPLANFPIGSIEADVAALLRLALMNESEPALEAETELFQLYGVQIERARRAEVIALPAR